MITLGALPALISLVEGLFGPKSGQQKKATVLELVTSALGLLTTMSTGQQQALWKTLGPLIPPIIDALASALFPSGTTVEKGEAVRMAASFIRGDFSPLERGTSFINTVTEPTN
jgi:Na+/H+ antiporter NhaC